MLKTFKKSSSERVPSECRASAAIPQYIADIFQKDIFIGSPDILPIYLRCSSMLTVQCGVWLMILSLKVAGYCFEVEAECREESESKS